jgi:hypothetical protein
MLPEREVRLRVQFIPAPDEIAGRQGFDVVGKSGDAFLDHV